MLIVNNPEGVKVWLTTLTKRIRTPPIISRTTWFRIMVITIIMPLIGTRTIRIITTIITAIIRTGNITVTAAGTIGGTTTAGAAAKTKSKIAFFERTITKSP
ncbi:hypothetical protein [Paenibacillus flagellatus]|uniref:hypothetical protein n=1 Tax=Paenibacillus flagellatus TaxID=2211139 RepID=UPI0013053F35|nr:hypothetical protein [Paenibacillus flagellatus]